MGWRPGSWRFGRAGPETAIPPDPLSSNAAPADPGWRALAPLQRSTRALEPVAPLDRFTGDLRSHQDPRFLAPLSHLRRNSGPSGQVEGLVRPGIPVQRSELAELGVRAGAATPQRPQPTRSVQRFAAPWDATSPPMITAAEEGGDTEAPTAEAPTAEAPTAKPTVATAGVVQGLPPLVLRRLTAAPPADPTPLHIDLPAVQTFAPPVITTTSAPLVASADPTEPADATTPPPPSTHREPPEPAVPASLPTAESPLVGTPDTPPPTAATAAPTNNPPALPGGPSPPSVQRTSAPADPPMPVLRTAASSSPDPAPSPTPASGPDLPGESFQGRHPPPSTVSRQEFPAPSTSGRAATAATSSTFEERPTLGATSPDRVTAPVGPTTPAPMLDRGTAQHRTVVGPPVAQRSHSSDPIPVPDNPGRLLLAAGHTEEPGTSPAFPVPPSVGSDPLAGPDLIVSRETAPSQHFLTEQDAVDAPLTGDADPLTTHPESEHVDVGAPSPAPRAANGPSLTVSRQLAPLQSEGRESHHGGHEHVHGPARPGSEGRLTAAGPALVISRQTTASPAPAGVTTTPVGGHDADPDSSVRTFLRTNVPSGHGPAVDIQPGTGPSTEALPGAEPTATTSAEWTRQDEHASQDEQAAEAPLTGEVGPLTLLADQHLQNETDPPDGTTLQRLPVVEHHVAVPLAGQAEPLTQIQPFEAPHVRPGTVRGSLHVGVPVRKWATADPVPRSGVASGGSTSGHAPLRTLVPLHRMFAGEQGALPTGDPLPSTSSGIPGRGPRVGVGLPLPGPSGSPGRPPHSTTGPGWAPLQRTSPAGIAGQGAARADLPVAPRSPLRGAPRSPFPGSPESPLPESSTSGFTEVLLQRATEPEPPAEESTEPGGGSGSGPGAGPAPSVAAAPDPVAVLPSGRALDELVERLYEPLTARLKTELWLDRERSGLMVNLRR